MFSIILTLQEIRVTHSLVKMAARVAWWQVLGLAHALAATLATPVKVCHYDGDILHVEIQYAV